jgi:dTDP-4-dehydrorhamnose 3,5-epimerase-like enzyme
VANGSVFGVWVDLRKGDNFGKVVTIKIDPAKAIFVPRGIANGYQTLEPNVVYTYLVSEHWHPGVKYLSINIFDPDLAINWPIDTKEAIISEKDRANPLLKEILPWEV